ncbi:MAG: ATP-binding protein [Paracoccaceae bacterium]
MPDDDKARVIGKITSVSADKLVIELHRGNDSFTVVGFDDVHYVARLGSFVLIPVQANYVVGEVTGLWEKDPLSSRSGSDGTEMNKAASAKFLDLTPIGMIKSHSTGKFEFGVSVFPPLYADALYARDEDLDKIFQVVDPMEPVTLKDKVGVDHVGTVPKHLEVGTSVVFNGYPVKVRIDEFFGGHIAILGNTGSGKSCTVATILQSLLEKPDEFAARGASFLLFDVNGEYRPAFAELPGTIHRQYLRAKTDAVLESISDISINETVSEFRLPHWFMSVEEWELLLRASERTQQPVLRVALGFSSILSETSTKSRELRNHIVAMSVRECLQGAGGDSPVSKRQKASMVLHTFGTDDLNASVLTTYCWDAQYANFPQGGNHQECFLDHLSNFIKEEVKLPRYDNKPFKFEALADCFDLALLYQEAHGNRQIRDHCSQMITRFNWVSEREEFSFLRADPGTVSNEESSPEKFVEMLVGLERNSSGLNKTSQITILDLNSAADEVVEITAAVVARMCFERLRKASPRNRFPIHMVLEEAHRYIAEKPSRYAIDASRTFERIAKEGRKYGAFLLVASQRPSELSKTVLSQCSNFVVHRIQNPDDLAHIRQMTPFISESVLKRLPSLPKQHALIFGNSVNIPTTYKVRTANPLPDSDDTKIGKIWYRPENFEVGLSVVSTQEILDD